MRCLEKDRTRRYETAKGLALDIQRYLNHEAVIARPPSRLDGFRKLVRRNKVGFAAACGAVSALAVTAAAITLLLFWPSDQGRVILTSQPTGAKLYLEGQ